MLNLIRENISQANQIVCKAVLVLLSLLTMISPNQLCEVFLFVCSGKAGSLSENDNNARNA